MADEYIDIPRTLEHSWIYQIKNYSYVFSLDRRSKSS